MNKKVSKIDNLTGNSFGPGTVIQSEDVTQTITISNPEVANAYQEILKSISEIKDEGKKEQAEFYAETLKQSIDSKNSANGMKMLKFLQGIVGTSAAITTITKFFT
ncbi:MULTISPECIES: hypothetical protein [Bacillus]|uniref:hypothetical protein n=1 Tax=Bacillus TaxID=1386 RepID=UPI0011A8C1B0|nr:hypothetical protein [Bacillus pumilus]